MHWTSRTLLISPFRWTAASLCFLLFLSGGRSHAQNGIYTWTDERGVLHFSDSMVPPKHVDHATMIVMPPKETAPVEESEESEIPLVILNNDPSQKFVRAVLTGEYSAREVLMLVDTGAQISLIDETLADELALEHIEDAIVTGVTGAAQGWIGRLPGLKVGTEEIKDLRVMVGPTTGHLLLGMDVLEQLQLSIGPQSMQRIR